MTKTIKHITALVLLVLFAVGFAEAKDHPITLVYKDGARKEYIDFKFVLKPAAIKVKETKDSPWTTVNANDLEIVLDMITDSTANGYIATEYVESGAKAGNYTKRKGPAWFFINRDGKLKVLYKVANSKGQYKATSSGPLSSFPSTPDDGYFYYRSDIGFAALVDKADLRIPASAVIGFIDDYKELADYVQSKGKNIVEKYEVGYDAIYRIAREYNTWYNQSKDSNNK